MKVQETSPIFSPLIHASRYNGSDQAPAKVSYLGHRLGDGFETGHVHVAPQTVLQRDTKGTTTERALLVLGSGQDSAATVMHCGQESRVNARSATLIRSAIPFRIDVHSGSIAYVVAPATDLAGREPRVHNLAGHPVTGMIPALVSDIAAIAGSPAGADVAHDETAAGQLLDRLALALSVEIDKRSDLSFANGDLHRRAIDLIGQRCQQPDLKALDLATAMGVSVRQLESMFKRRRSSTLEAIATARIAIAREHHADLVDQDLDAIAHASGFYDASHLRRTWTKVTGEPIGAQVGLFA